MHLTLEERILVDLVRSQITGENFILPEEAEVADWRKIMQESAQQAVSLLAFEAVSQVEDRIPAEVYEGWMQTAYAVLANNAQVVHSQNELTDLLDKYDFKYIILKGLSAAADYPRPDLRSLGDVDFLIDAEKQGEIGECLLAQGYNKTDGDHSCHVTFKKPGAYLEMHFEIAGIPFGEKGAWVRTVMATAMDDRRKLDVDGATFFAPDEVRHALVLLLHMQGHMLGEGLGLRHLCDWACFINNTAEKPYWEQSLLPFLKKLGLFTYAAVMTRTASQYLGVICPVWAAGISDELCAEVMYDIFESGNFGKKDFARARSGMMVSQHGKDGTKHGVVYNLYHTLHQSTAEAHPIVNRIRALHPFLDVGRALRYLWLTLIGKRPSLTKMAPKAAQRKSLYEKLHVFEAEE